MGWTLTVPKLAYRKAVLANNPVGYWRLGESGVLGSPDTLVAVDETGTNDGGYIKENGTITLGVNGLVRGKNTAVNFNGNHGGVGLGFPNFDQLAIKTIEVWIKPDDLTNDQLIFREGGEVNGFAMGISSSNFEVGVASSSVITKVSHSTAGYSVGDIIHIVGIIDQTNNILRLYINNVLEAEDTGSSVNAHDGITDCRIGTARNNAGNDGNPLTGGTANRDSFDGVIDEVAIYNKALTPAQIRKHYNAGV